MERVTIKDIANASGVSIATVSIIINGNGKMRVSSETAERVKSVAKEMGYQPNVNAQILKGKPASIIALIIPDIMNPFYPEMVRGAVDVAGKEGYQVMLLNSDDNIERMESFFNTFVQLSISGIILTGISMNTQQVKNIFAKLQKRNNIPIVVAGSKMEGYNSVYSDSVGSYEAVNMLAKVGHKRIGAVIHYEDADLMKVRINEYNRALSDNGIKLDPQIIFKMPNNSMEEATKLMGRILSKTPRLTALFVPAGDSRAIRIIEATAAFDVRIPQDLSIVGHDDIEYARIMKKPLSTVWQPKYEMGYAAVKLLHDLILKKKEVGDSITMPTRLINRDTVCKHTSQPVTDHPLL